MNYELIDKLGSQAQQSVRRQQLVDLDFLAKFAEMIVRECMEQVWYTREDGINGNISEVIKDRIKQHFGVEE